MDKYTITMIHPESDSEIEVQPGSVENAKANGWTEKPIPKRKKETETKPAKAGFLMSGDN